MDLRLGGRAAFVVGATGEIGASIASTFAGEGARVVIAGRDEDRLQALLSSLGAASPGSVVLDLTDERSVREGVDRAEALLGGIEILVCSAMGETFGSVWTMDRETWENALRVKYVGTADLCRRVAGRMVERRSGVIATLIGVAAEVLFPSNPVGGDVNVALARFTRFLAAAVAPAGVRVVGVSPGYVRGRRLAAFADTAANAIEATIPLGRICTPQEVADLITFVVSPRAGYITGTIVTIDGGLSLPAPVERSHDLPIVPQPLDRLSRGGATEQ